MAEQRVIASGGKVGGGAAKGGAGAEGEEKPAKGGKKKLIVIVAAAALVLGGGGAAYFLLLAPKSAEASATPSESPTPVLGEVAAVEAMSLNLADGHYLRIGLAMQLTEEASAGGGGHGSSSEFDVTKAQDAVIDLFSGQTLDVASSADGRRQLKDELLARLNELYEDGVVDVYFTDYVTQ